MKYNNRGLITTKEDYCLHHLVQLRDSFSGWGRIFLQGKLDDMINRSIIDESQLDNDKILIEVYCPRKIQNYRDDEFFHGFEFAYPCKDYCLQTSEGGRCK
ncbi:MAG: hypothetical protein QW727_00665 [Candidatus Pacearchaeota archaeon]